MTSSRPPSASAAIRLPSEARLYLATIALLRERQLRAGAPARLDARGHGSVRTALLEVEAGLVAAAATVPVARACSVTPLAGFVVKLGFTDGTVCTVDLEPCLRGRGREALKRDPALFAAVSVDGASGAIVWPNVEGLSPEALWEQAPAAFLRHGA